jgi:hypothetical protein
MVYMRILAVIISCIAKIRRLRSSAIAPSGQLVGRVNGFILKPMKREGETDDDGHVPVGFKLRKDQTFVQHAARVSMPTVGGMLRRRRSCRKKHLRQNLFIRDTEATAHEASIL